MWVYPEIEIQIVNSWIFGDPISDFQTQVLIAWLKTERIWRTKAGDSTNEKVVFGQENDNTVNMDEAISVAKQ